MGQEKVIKGKAGKGNWGLSTRLGILKFGKIFTLDRVNYLYIIT
jgi:hypothetical protein